MKDAAARDVDAHERNEPALHKLRLLPILVQHLERKELCDTMLDHHILEGFMAWLEPFPADGSLPLYEIRKTLFELLLKLPIHADHLREDRIGPLVRFYESFPRETSEIRRLAKDCAEKWMRPLMNLPSSMRNAGETATRVRVIEDLEAQTRRRVLNRPSSSGDGGASSQSGFGSGASQLVTSQGSGMSQSGSQPGQRLRLPPTRGVGYTVRPEDNVPESHAANRRKEQGGLAKVVAKLKGPTSKRG
ncbi:hypothetical protein BCR44DRAFT_116166 [Catenaria anguillulae PL171]|uniref:TFIIS N-terminal domain-containing protein n=1 Tax=Catenaria anguillulae PL171 TaxID=765915 RepID=A0A1Y2HSB6_9FUNG|nr:hypothetical protein BCR44DRAFT_116166 [Catenaria anguillulae PL171]